MNFDEQLEKELDNYFKILYRYDIESYSPHIVLKHLLDVYNKTNYPGIYYRIGNLYEYGYFKKLKENKSIHYYELAAKQGYVPAMNHLAELGLREFKIHGYRYAHWSVTSATKYNDSYGKYLLARYCLLDGISTNNKQQIKDGVQFLKESTDQGNEEAKEFLEMWR